MLSPRDASAERAFAAIRGGAARGLRRAPVSWAMESDFDDEMNTDAGVDGARSRARLWRDNGWTAA
jgi:hypothetical protein